MHKPFAVLVLAIAALAIFGAVQEVSADTQPVAATVNDDDGWRYTTRGWEHVSAWQLLEPDHDQVATTNGHTPLVTQIAGALLIAGGLLGLGWLLTLEIDPIELRAFRLHRQRIGTGFKSV